MRLRGKWLNTTFAGRFTLPARRRSSLMLAKRCHGLAARHSLQILPPPTGVRNREFQQHWCYQQTSTNPTIARYDAAIAALVALREADW